MGKLKSFTDKVWYGTGAIGLDLSYGMFYEKLYYYQTNILKLDTKFLLALSAVARIWDGVNDPMMGSIVDNTNTKFGRYRPWVVTGATLNAVVLFLLFFCPWLKTGGTGVYIYAAVMYVLWGMTNTSADIPYWSMVPSFTTDPNERSIIATVARAFSGLGQGVVSILAPVILNAFGTPNASGGTDWTSKGYTVCAGAFAFLLIFFAFLSMSKVKENVTVRPKEKFSFRGIFDVLKGNDQLRVFILFALLSNTGFYTVSGVKDHFFNVVVSAEAQSGTWFSLSKFNLFMTAGSVLGLLIVPVMLKITTRRRTYQFSLLTATAGYLGMAACGLTHAWLGMSIFYFINQLGTASMFVSQTVFLSDVVDYGEVTMGERKESVTFSMKGFLQKMAYTVQTVILNATLSAVHYNDETAAIGAGRILTYSARVRSGIKAVMYIVPPVCFVLSLIVFSTKFKLHGAYMEDITKQVSEAREKRLAAAEVAENG